MSLGYEPNLGRIDARLDPIYSYYVTCKILMHSGKVGEVTGKQHEDAAKLTLI